ncbi:hypothetical protein ACLOJK_035774 [Asimina triloba]
MRAARTCHLTGRGGSSHRFNLVFLRLPASHAPYDYHALLSPAPAQNPFPRNTNNNTSEVEEIRLFKYSPQSPPKLTGSGYKYPLPILSTLCLFSRYAVKRRKIVGDRDTANEIPPDMDLARSDLPAPKTENTDRDEGEKAALVHDAGSGPLRKKARVDGGRDMKRVAEIIMVLSATGKLRGGRSPSGPEKGMMAEAREKLVGLCEIMAAPKDLVSRDAVKAVVDDLGFSKWKDQRFGFRMPRMSIAEKVAFMERKAEESKKFSLRTGKNSQLLQTGFGANAESSSFHGVTTHRFSSDKSSPMPNLPAGYRLASSTGPLSTSDSMNPLNQSQASGPQLASNQLTLSSNLSESCSSLAVSRSEGAQFDLGTSSNVRPHMAQVGGAAFFSMTMQLIWDAEKLKLLVEHEMRDKTEVGDECDTKVAKTSSSNDHLLNKTPSHFQSSSTAVNTATQATKVLDHAPMMAEGGHKVTASESASQAGRENAPKSLAIQTGNLYSVHQTSQGANFVQASSLDSTHNDIARNVLKVLQPRALDPNWTSVTDYINKSVPCQLCKVDINDTESLLVCDCCEKGVHLKCLQSFLPKAITKDDWYCPRCVIINKGKPFPPKYGRISRNVSTSKAPANVSAVQAISEKKTASSDQKVNHQKMVANGKHDLLNPVHVANVGNNHVKSAPDAKTPDAREVLSSDASVFRTKINDGPCYGATPQTQERLGLVSDPAGQTVERVNQNTKESKSSQSDMDGSTFVPKSVPKEESEHLHMDPGNHSDVGSDAYHKSQFSHVSSEDDKREVGGCLESSANKVNEVGNHSVEFEKPEFKGECEHKPDVHVKVEDQNGADAESGGTSDNGNEAIDGSRFSSEGLQGVNWVDGILKIVDEKAHYRSCCINGTMYKLEDHILFTSDGHNLLPAKLQVLWEDNKTKLKWAAVNLFYFPSDLPKTVDRPCSPENNEVYESKNQSSIMVASIAGHCKVLPPNKFKEESEKRINVEEASSGSPVFLCNRFSALYEALKCWLLNNTFSVP